MKNLFVIVAFLVFTIPTSAQQKTTEEKPLAPTFTGISLDGKTINSGALRGKILVLNLWFINCPNCIEEIKLLNQIVEDYKDK